MTIFQRQIPLIITVIVVFGIGAYTVQKMVEFNGGRYVYTLDDAYIHLAAASNLVEHGVFGVTRHAFSSSTSSPLFTLTLAALVGLFGRSDVYPLLLSVVAALVLLFAYHRLLLSFDVGMVGRLVLMLVFAHMSGMLWSAHMGLEHVLHLCVSLLLVMHWQTLYERRAGVDALLMLLAVVALSVRFESLFLVGALSVMLLVDRRPGAAVLLSAAALLPLVVYGVVSLANGGLVLPNSLIMKGIVHQGDDRSGILHFLGYRAVSLFGMTWTYYILPLLVVPGLLLSPLRTDRRMHVVFVLLMTLVLHMMLLDYGGQRDRYVAYLFGLFAAYGGILMHSVVRTYPNAWMGRERVLVRIGLVLFFGMLIVPMHFEWKQRVSDVPAMSKNIGDQQIHMATFVRDFLPDTMAIAVNDIGAVSYYSRVPILDLYGIGDDEVTLSWYRGEFTTARISELLRARGVRLLLVYTRWFHYVRALPHGLLPVGEWTIANNLVCGDDNVAFLATDSAAYRMIAPRFREYSEKRLPRDVSVLYDSTAGYGRTDALVRR